MQGNDFLEKYRLGARDILDSLPRHWIRKEPNKVTWMASIEDHADLAVGFETADTRSMTRARIDDDERSPLLIDLNIRRWNDSHERVIHWAFELATVDDKFCFKVQNMRSGLGLMLAKLVAALTHDIPE